MADTTTRKLISEPEFDALVAACNALRVDLASMATLVHRDNNIVPLVTGGAFATLVDCEALCNEMKASYNAHVVDVGAHLVTDVGNVTAAAAATDEASSETLATDLKAKFNAHVAQAGVHINNDAGVVTAADAIGLPSLKTLCADLKAKYNAHIARAMSSTKIVRGPA